MCSSNGNAHQSKPRTTISSPWSKRKKNKNSREVKLFKATSERFWCKKRALGAKPNKKR